MVRSFGKSGVAALVGRGDEVASGEEVAGAPAAGRSRRESRVWRGGRISNVEGEGRGGWEAVGVIPIPPGVGAAEGMVSSMDMSTNNDNIDLLIRRKKEDDN